MTCNHPDETLCRQLGRHVHGRMWEIWQGRNVTIEDAIHIRDKWISDPRVSEADRPGLLRQATALAEKSVGLGSTRPCVHLGEPNGETVECVKCGKGTRLKTFSCEVYGTCTIGRRGDGVAGCCKDRAGHICADYLKPSLPSDPIIVRIDDNGIGDHLMGLTTAAGLRRENPERRIVFATRRLDLRPWLELFDAGVNDYVTYEFNGDGLDLHPLKAKSLAISKGTSWAAEYARYAGTTLEMPKARPISPAATAWAEQYRDAVVIAPGACNGERIWPIASYLRVEAVLRARGCPVVVIDDDPLRVKPFVSRVLLKESPSRVAAVMLAARCVLGNDSGMAHVAGMLGAETVVVSSAYNGHDIYAVFPSVSVIQGPSLAGITPERFLREIYAAASRARECTYGD